MRLRLAQALMIGILPPIRPEGGGRKRQGSRYS